MRSSKPACLGVTLVVAITFGVFTLVHAADGVVKTGMTAQQVFDLLGKPKASMGSSKSGMYIYEDCTVSLRDGRVSHIKRKTQAPKARSGGRAEAVGTPVTPELTPNAENEAPLFKRAAHPSALFFGPIPVEFDELDVAQARAPNIQIAQQTSAATARNQFRDLRRLLRRYPVELLAKRLNCIYFVKEIRGNDGVKMAGFVDDERHCLYMSNANQFAALFAQLVTRSDDRFGESTEWHMHSAGRYSSDNPAMIPSEQSSQDLLRMGFVTSDCMLSPVRDAAEILTMLYGNPKALFAVAESNKTIARKVDDVLKFYAELHFVTTGQAVVMDQNYFISRVSAR